MGIGNPLRTEPVGHAQQITEKDDMYLFDVSEDYPEAYWFKYDQAVSPDHLSFICGERQSPPTTTPTFKNNKKISAARFSRFDLLQSDVLEFASAKLAAILLQYADDVQIFPAEIYIGKEKLNGFHIFNIIATAPCIDTTSSEHEPMFSFMPDGPLKFLTLKSLPAQTLAGYDIVRAKESPQRVFVSEKFKRHCESAGLGGLQFVDCSSAIRA